ncbi:response regulator [Novosphingobium terrae]|uniref:hypothetical protein n=1 Tax=Novosphingobium terrae TaxID=2726189 RepID=UPI001981C58E|nr:hypothetical protein [Novosphingobium terrae]
MNERRLEGAREPLRLIEGQEAHARLVSTRLDIVLLDRMVPGLDRPSVVRRAQRREGCQRLVMLLTAVAGIEARVVELQVRADLYLVKPFDFLGLAAWLDRLSLTSATVGIARLSWRGRR